ncbi:hypothetical protein BaRGS_00037292 [Batillaria attramentaria]|uniref:GH26 domain-containing protein n=1 Tax=Batillaria attramentaria TaxID=370345 RepID=A0ABD0J9C9_9CAEN
MRAAVFLFFGVCFASLSEVRGQRLRVSGTHIMRGHDRFFLSGANSAWVAYGYDFGNHQYQQRRAVYLSMLDVVSQAGGNSMRTWVHIHGATSPKFNSSGHVTGLDNDGSFLSDFKRYLDDARARPHLPLFMERSCSS